jgi:hypothetical protein
MKSAILFLLLAGVIGVSVFLTYERTIIKKDFETFNSEEEVIEEEDSSEGISDEEEADEADESTAEMASPTDAAATESGS